jgi:hypothetical protein
LIRIIIAGTTKVKATAQVDVNAQVELDLLT